MDEELGPMMIISQKRTKKEQLVEFLETLKHYLEIDFCRAFAVGYIDKDNEMVDIALYGEGGDVMECLLQCWDGIAEETTVDRLIKVLEGRKEKGSD